ncbi:threonine--tRNA ligase [Candidatus Woesebacteria bacterium RBG_16_36_11]|uniref:Threonine--tRNA ligase n=3 Tax=Candidatus Woeseibacteriota TaxID=1752722 RepID=A0A1F7X749_9BACT|nr:MAG: threonine--tRNA ligase [Candidatus Woesebacteria bacterium RBG_13_36_22]OGM10896.1 MAG: threonine--tRNA ligase [Candidatus Woesebacteria bacterium RBG_16_36_11]OGM16866.1 MAG: threonine--tRNA ligase [Candidatus Woesebacteria bacterium RBG_19FT_COMBO_37_29]
MQKNIKPLEALRHSTEHVLTQAMEKLYPGIIKAMGPATAEGFYFDFDYPDKISEEEFPKIEAEMSKIIKKDLPFKKDEISVPEAIKLFKNNPFKQEWLDEIEKRKEKVSIYWTGDEFVDLCSGPHIPSTGKISSFKLLSTAGAYWRGDEKNKMLTRVYGTAFLTQKELDEYLKMLAEAKKRDHKKLGKTLDLFTFSDLVGPGLPLFTPKGALIRRLLNDYIEEIQSKKGYQQVWTNQFAKAELYKISGHYEKYKEGMFKVISNYSDEEFYLKPMNCPQHTQIYASRARSYKDLPLRYTDFAMLYRDEKPGELNGLARVRSFSQDDCHIFCREDQIDEEIDTMLSMIKEILKTFGFKYRYRLSTRDPQHPEKYLGDPKIWDKVEKWAVEIMKRNKIEYYDAPGEAAFYAPKMDLMATDALGREWQLSTIQIDFVMPERFGLEYTDKDGAKKHPVMLHRAIIGSSERFIMVLLEHFAGNLPTWLTPVQVKILPITDKQITYANSVLDKLLTEDIRAEINDRSETLGAKIRDAQLDKNSYMLILGEKEEKTKTVAKRGRSGKDYGQMKLDKFIANIKKEIAEKTIN